MTSDHELKPASSKEDKEEVLEGKNHMCAWLEQLVALSTIQQQIDWREYSAALYLMPCFRLDLSDRRSMLRPGGLPSSALAPARKQILWSQKHNRKAGEVIPMTKSTHDEQVRRLRLGKRRVRNSHA